MNIQQQPVNNPAGNEAQSKPKTRFEAQRRNLVVTQGSPTTTRKKQKSNRLKCQLGIKRNLLELLAQK